MNRDTLVKIIAEKTNEYKYVVENIVNTYEQVIEETVLGGEDVRLHGFITFSMKEHAPKTYFNPQTGESKTIPSAKKIKVKVSERLNGLV